MSANNYIHIEERVPEKYSVSEKDYESDGEIHALGIFGSIKLAVKKAEDYIQEGKCEIEYGIRFSLIKEDKEQEKRKEKSRKDFDI